MRKHGRGDVSPSTFREISQAALGTADGKPHGRTALETFFKTVDVEVCEDPPKAIFIPARCTRSSRSAWVDDSWENGRYMAATCQPKPNEGESENLRGFPKCYWRYSGGRTIAQHHKMLLHLPDPANASESSGTDQEIPARSPAEWARDQAATVLSWYVVRHQRRPRKLSSPVRATAQHTLDAR